MNSDLGMTEPTVRGAEPAHKQLRRIASLDGLRAISIILVYLAHLAGTRNFPFTRQISAAGELGYLGVKVFFVISGFLITSLLLNEVQSKGHISLKNFYFRRLVRIFPACYVYVSVFVVLSLTGLITLHWPDVYHGYTYTVNYYHTGRSWYIGHLWSLSVEEQFYMLWPGVLAWLGVRRGMYGAAGAVMVIPLIRVLTELFLKSQAAGISESFQTVADALAAGCLLAGARQHLDQSKRYLSFLRSKWFALVPCVLVVSFITLRFALLGELIGETLLNLSIVLVIDRSVRFPQDAFGRLLNTGPMVRIGVLSYSLYLWQQPFLNRRADFAVCSFPLNVVLACACAWASYSLVEKPLLDLRERLRNRAAPVQQGLS